MLERKITVMLPTLKYSKIKNVAIYVVGTIQDEDNNLENQIAFFNLKPRRKLLHTPTFARNYGIFKRFISSKCM